MYHLLMARLLGPSSYGALEGAISLLYILSVPTITLSLVVVKYTAGYLGKKEFKEVDNLYNYLFSKIAIFGSIFTIIILILSPLITNFLKLSNIYISIFLSLTFLVNLFYILDKSTLQGMTRFFKFSFLSFIETFVKIFLGVILVYLGFSVDGAFAGIGIGLLAALIFSQVFLKGVVKSKFNLKSDFKHKKELLKFAIPTFVTTLAITSLFTTDVILVRHFFHGSQSGYYSALSVLGKVIYFAASPVILVVFPLVSEYHAKGGKYEKFLFQGLCIVLVICFVLTSAYFLEPKLIISLLFGPKFFPMAGFMVYLEYLFLYIQYAHCLQIFIFQFIKQAHHILLQQQRFYKLF